MPDKLSVRIHVDQSNQTVSKFVVSEKGQVTFYNDAAAVATVHFEQASPLCQGNTPKKTIAIDAGTSQKLNVCKGTANKQFKYDVTVAGAQTEDPIFIIEKFSSGSLDKKPIFFPEGIPMLVIGGLVGILIGYLVARRLLTRNPRP